jgi:hypothetical protein
MAYCVSLECEENAQRADDDSGVVLGSVFFFPEASLTELEQKDEDWAADTMFGQLPSSRPQRHL